MSGLHPFALHVIWPPVLAPGFFGDGFSSPPTVRAGADFLSAPADPADVAG